MEKYGKVFDQTFNIDKERAYRLINEYFDNPDMKKIKNDDNESIYMAYNNTQLLTNNQFIICTCVKDNHPIGTIKKLISIKWDAFQTRMLDFDKSNHLKFSYIAKNTPKFMSKLVVSDRTQFITKYICKEYNLYISLLHENKHEYEYPDIGILNQSLESFKTIITFM